MDKCQGNFHVLIPSFLTWRSKRPYPTEVQA